MSRHPDWDKPYLEVVSKLISPSMTWGQFAMRFLRMNIEHLLVGIVLGYILAILLR